MSTPCPFASTLSLADRLEGGASCALALVTLAELTPFLPAGRDPASGERFLSREEEESLARFSLEKRRREWLGGRLAAKCAVSRLLGSEKPAWPAIGIGAAEDGRPLVRTQPGLHLSISHSGPLAGALAATTACGFDLQELTGRLLALRSRFLSRPEEALLARELLPRAGTIGALTLLWSAKEAIRKLMPLAPLLGFLEMTLLEVRQEAGGPDPHFSLRFLAERSAAGPGGELAVQAWLARNLAWALAVLPPNLDGVGR